MIEKIIKLFTNHKKTVVSVTVFTTGLAVAVVSLWIAVQRSNSGQVARGEIKEKIYNGSTEYITGVLSLEGREISDEQLVALSASISEDSVSLIGGSMTSGDIEKIKDIISSSVNEQFSDVSDTTRKQLIDGLQAITLQSISTTGNEAGIVNKSAVELMNNELGERMDNLAALLNATSDETMNNIIELQQLLITMKNMTDGEFNKIGEISEEVEALKKSVKKIEKLDEKNSGELLNRISAIEVTLGTNTDSNNEKVSTSLIELHKEIEQLKGAVSNGNLDDVKDSTSKINGITNKTAKITTEEMVKISEKVNELTSKSDENMKYIKEMQEIVGNIDASYLSKMTETFKASESELKDLKSYNAEVKKSLSKVENFEKTFSKSLDDYKKELDNIKKDLINSGNFTVEVSDKFTELETTIEGLKTKDNVSENDIRTINSKVSNIEESLRDIDLNDMADDLLDLSDDVSEYSNRILVLEGGKNELEARTATAEEDIGNLKTSVSDINDSISSINDSISDINDEISDFKSETETNLDNLESFITDNYKTASDTEEALENLRDLVEQGYVDLDTYTTLLNSYNNTKLYLNTYGISGEVTYDENGVATLNLYRTVIGDD